MKPPLKMVISSRHKVIKGMVITGLQGGGKAYYALEYINPGFSLADVAVWDKIVLKTGSVKPGRSLRWLLSPGYYTETAGKNYKSLF